MHTKKIMIRVLSVAVGIFVPALPFLQAQGQTPAASEVRVTPDSAVFAEVESSKSLWECENTVTQAYGERLRASEGASNADEQRRAYDAWRTAMFKRCIARVDMATVDPSILLHLASLAIKVGQQDVVAQSVDRYLDRAPADSQTHAVVDVIMMYMRSSIGWEESRIPDSERFAAMLDAAPAQRDGARLQGYQVLARYLEDPERSRLLDSARAIAHRMPVVERATYTREIDNAYENLVRVAAVQGRHDAVPSLLAEAHAVLDSVPRPSYSFLYGKVPPLIGSRVQPLSPDYWLNAGADSGKTYRWDNRITVIEYTATWCAGCRQGYPVLIDLAAKYPGVVRPLLLTYLEGVSVMEQHESTAEELVFKHNYWVKKHGITFPILVAEKGDEDDSTSQTGKKHPMLQQFAFSWMPTYVVVDGGGIVRYIGSSSPTIAWELNSVVERLLAKGDRAAATP